MNYHDITEILLKETLHLYRQHNTKKTLNNYKTTQTSTHGFQYNHTNIFNQTSLELFLHIHIVYISNNHHDSLYFLSFFHLQLFTTPLVSSNFLGAKLNWNVNVKFSIGFDDVNSKQFNVTNVNYHDDC
jgi:hypothetical protein